MENGQEQINNKTGRKRRKVCRLLYRHMSALRGAFSVMVRDFLFHEIVGGTDPGGNYGMVCAFRSHRWKNPARM